MATSLQRVLTLVIIINIVLIFAGRVYSNTYSTQIQEDENYYNSIMSSNINYSLNYGNGSATDSQYYQSSYGDTNYGGARWFSLFGGFQGIGLITERYSQNNPAELFMIRKLNLVIAILYALLALEGFLLFYGKKTT